MDGLINLDKPLKLTSARAVHHAKQALGRVKVGHAGTLDPLADGVLLLCLGKGTKLVERLMDQPKVYVATGRLDGVTSSFDLETAVEPVSVVEPPTRAAVEQAAAGLVGSIEQVPPATSALKVGGRPAYRLARRGDVIELAARTVQVYAFDIEGYAWPEVRFRVACGRGVYVRALIRDLGVALGCGGYLTSLRRTAVGPFRCEQSVTLERLRAIGASAAASELLWSVDAVRELLATGDGSSSRADDDSLSSRDATTPR